MVNDTRIVGLMTVAVLLLLAVGVVRGQTSSSTAASCTLDREFSLSNDDGLFPMECQIGPEFNQFKMNYSYSGGGAAAYFLTESQYDSYVEHVKQDTKYVPTSADFLLRFYTTNFGWASSQGTLTSYPSNTYGKIRLLVKRNSDFKGKAYMNIKLDMTPQNDFTAQYIIIAGSVGGVLALCCCVACIATLVVCCVKRRKASYAQIV